MWESWSTPLSLLDFSFALSVSLRFYIMLGMIDLIHETRHLCTLPCGLIGTKNVQNLKHVTGSKSISQNPKQVPKSQTLPRVQVFLDSGTCFASGELFLDPGTCFTFYEVFCLFEFQWVPLWENNLLNITIHTLLMGHTYLCN